MSPSRPPNDISAATSVFAEPTVRTCQMTAFSFDHLADLHDTRRVGVVPFVCHELGNGGSQRSLQIFHTAKEKMADGVVRRAGRRDTRNPPVNFGPYQAART